jgi:hypothetical protein
VLFHFSISFLFVLNNEKKNLPNVTSNFFKAEPKNNKKNFDDTVKAA